MDVDGGRRSDVSSLEEYAILAQLSGGVCSEGGVYGVDGSTR